MRIKNEYVEIKVGNKVYTKQNMILNTYLKAIFDKQFVQDMNIRYLRYCYLKLDTPLENIDYDSEISSFDFDIVIPETIKPSISATDKNIKVLYNFEDRVYFFKRNGGSWAGITGSNFDMFEGKRVVGIGFGVGFGINAKAFAYLDTRNMNIVINKNERFRVSRLDNIISDGISKGIEYPLHLVNDIVKKDPKYIQVNNVNYEEITKSQLYSIGFGNTIGYMEEEYLINDVETDRDDNSITFNVNRTKKVGHYPSEDLHFTFYPTMDNSKYLIFKYRLYRIYRVGEENIITNLDKYYTMSKPNENFGNLEIKLKIER